MNDIARIAAIGLIAGVLAAVIRKTNTEIALQISLAAGALIVIMVVGYISQAIGFIEELKDQLSGIEVIGDVARIVGVAYIAEFSASALKDAGESAVASKVELAAKVVITVMTLPLLKQLADVLLRLAGAK